MFKIADSVSCKRFFADNTYEIDRSGFVVAVNEYTAEVRFSDGVTESHYFSALRHG